jgi:hypothetical protein
MNCQWFYPKVLSSDRRLNAALLFRLSASYDSS